MYLAIVELDVHVQSTTHVDDQQEGSDGPERSLEQDATRDVEHAAHKERYQSR
jgi:hypothetical protein